MIIINPCFATAGFQFLLTPPSIRVLTGTGKAKTRHPKHMDIGGEEQPFLLVTDSLTYCASIRTGELGSGVSIGGQEF